MGRIEVATSQRPFEFSGILHLTPMGHQNLDF